ncbi:Lysosomal Pro-X carboxypeptidase [Vitis vinifera]|uniref:Lysosomal Pro-X carboxypeptidase n=1 Tax=Vitis vinifera TaxID=29760 RepID=A0A438KFY6_VITVI|nr:Lysosomal Pro-X carboxypeptidase [Vitis vinifera]
MNSSSPKVSLQWLISILVLVIFFSATCVSPTQPKILPKLSVLGRTFLREPATFSESNSQDFQTFYYNQTLDHFNYRPESYTTFQHRYVMNFKYWGGANASAPIFAYLGAEGDLDYDLSGIGFLTDNAHQFKALLVYIEVSLMAQVLLHKFSIDYAEVLIYIKKKLLAENSPVIVVGASYGGMLASWFRLKYPHVALGALASSAPILYFEDITPQNGYYSIVTKDFREASESCYKTIRESWSEIDRVASEPNGLSILSKKFRTCDRLNNSDELKDYLDTIYCTAAQYNDPPMYPVTMACGGIDGAPEGSDILSRIFAGVVAFRGNRSCYHTNTNYFSIETIRGWVWQTCSEMVMPIGRGDNDTMFPPAPFNLTTFIQECTSIYGVSPRPHWVTTYYGGHNIELILRRFASNIIFSNGLRDPYSSGGVLKNISDSVLAILTVNGSHCLDILPATSTDPEWLVMQRKAEVEVIESWIAQYYADLHAITK